MTREQLNVTNEDSDTVNLNDRTNWFTKLGMMGLYSTSEPVITSQPLWGEVGSMYIAQRIPEGTFSLPVHAQFSSRATLESGLRGLSSLLRSKGQELEIEFVREDSTSRTLTARYLSGIPTISDNNSWADLILSFAAQEPLWKGTSTFIEFTGGGGSEFFPFSFPFVLEADDIFESQVVDHVGDERTWPDFVATGPLTEFTLKNNTLGLEFRVVSTLLADEQITVNFDPRRTGFTVSDASSNSLFADIDKTKIDAWYLLPGNNTIEVAVLGSGTGTKMRMNYTPRYYSG